MSHLSRGKERGIHAASTSERVAGKEPLVSLGIGGLKRHECRAPLSGRLSLTNRQRVRSVPLRLLRRVLVELIEQRLALQDFDLSVCLVSSAQIARLNETFLRHAGATDVLAFDYSESGEQTLRGEIFVCVEVAVAQARRFRTCWQSELVRYVVHGLLHLRGYDDHRPADRRRMKREEDRLLRQLEGAVTEL